MTDLEVHVNAKGRKELVKQVREKIKELGIQYIYYQFVSVTGRIVGKGIPSDHWEATAERGFQLVYGSTANLFVDRHRQYIGYGPEASELVGIPDPETFVQLPWDKRVARVFCTCFRNREEKVNPGGHLTSDCRGNLRLIHEQFQKDHKGLHLRHGCEPEMMWLKKGDDGLPQQVSLRVDPAQVEIIHREFGVRAEFNRGQIRRTRLLPGLGALDGVAHLPE